MNPSTILPCLVLFTLSPLLGQGLEGRGKGDSRLALEGDALPDVVAYDESGSPFPLRERLRGRPAVLVFGCLT